jgi:phosphoglycerate dehydrogenase-like enzyme
VPAPTVPRIVTAPATTGWIDAAVVAGGGEVVAAPDAEAVVWTHPADADGLRTLLAANPQLRWVQLPWAGIDAYRHLLDRDHVWSCAKGVYSDPVAEHALALLLAGFRNLGPYSAATSWTSQVGRNLLDARVTIVGGGGIAQVLIGLLAPFRCRVTVVRRHPAAMDGVERVLGTDHLHEALADADAVVLALSLLPETVGIIGAAELAAMPDHAWLINVARGAHVDTAALVAALEAGTIGGAGLDVTDPEPLPDGHPLWALPNVIITPHTANTKAMARPLLSARITENVRRWSRGEPLVGLIDVDLGY